MTRKPYDSELQQMNLNKLEKLIDYNILHFNELPAKMKWRTLWMIASMPVLWEAHKITTKLTKREEKQ